ncbi:MAG: hypothetical protein HYW00_01995 [Candidatus Colwellbacteria bacterium]|nr:hypothetical protein [Candidatus Colwellbacteria bacterium]
MNPKQFLLIGGLVLAVVGILGFVGVIGPTAEQSIFGSAWWFDNAENWAHLVLGIVALLAWKMLSASNQKILVILVGILGLLVGLYNFTSTSLLGANLENPADLVLHLVVGLWALYAGLSKRGAMTA